MKTRIKISLLLLLIAFVTKAQTQQITILDSTLNNQWLTLNKDWRYQKGDNMNWAKPDFGDASWKRSSNNNLNMPDGKNAIANPGEIVWFRKQIKADSTLNKAIVLNISQLGASEIYLDGKLIHQLGKVSSAINEVIFNNPYTQILELPLQKTKEQVLAVRFVNAQYKFPIYNITKGGIRIAVSTLSNANSEDVIKNNRIAANRQSENNWYITLGVAILMFIIFLSFFLFFPSEKINLHFASSLFFLILFVIAVIWSFGYQSNIFWLIFLCDTSVVVSYSISLYCIYKTFNQRLDIVYTTILFSAIIAIGCYFLYDPNIVAPVWATLAFIATTRIASKSWKDNRVGSILFISSSLVSIIVWTITVFNRIGLLQINLVKFHPFAFMLQPVVLSVYLGYAFGKRSQDLRLNLERVQKLSKEKESILSSQNETLEIQVQERTAALNQSLTDLKSTQSQLIQSEKMASLGELTAGIAHEIQNPLNFVNNFSELNLELSNELKAMVGSLGTGNAEGGASLSKVEVTALIEDISANSEKINHHGKRAADIVKGMLQHSRTSSGQKEPTDINALCDEYLRLAYHGYRAKDKSFNAQFETHLDPNLPKVNVVPQDIGRVVLNIINNAFFAVAKQSEIFNLKSGRQEVGTSKRQNGDDPTIRRPDEEYFPMVSISTRKQANTIEIIISDNGGGIPNEIKEKIFQPFFTTKPTGQGTGLGLSLSYDIVKAHGGELRVETKENEGSQFTIILPTTIF